MSAVEYVGYRKVDYISKSGRDVHGYTLFFNEKREYVNGLAAFDAWVTPEIYNAYFSSLQFGDVISLNYDRYGKISGINK